MKIKKTNKYNYKLLKLQLIKTYKKNNNNLIKINETINRLKKILFIIYKYHTKRKRLLFIGSPLQNTINLTKLISYSKHIIIPEFLWTNGLISNKKSLKNKQKQEAQSYHKLKKQSHLIIILNSLINKALLTEGYNSKIPIISLNSDLNIFDYKSSYKLSGSSQTIRAKIINTLLYSIIISTIKKADISLNKKLTIANGFEELIKLLKKSYKKKKTHNWYKKNNFRQTFLNSKNQFTKHKKKLSIEHRRLKLSKNE